MHKYDPANPLSIFQREQIANFDIQFHYCCAYATRMHPELANGSDREVMLKMLRTYEFLGWWEPQYELIRANDRPEFLLDPDIQDI